MRESGSDDIHTGAEGYDGQRFLVVSLLGHIRFNTNRAEFTAFIVGTSLGVMERP